ncbi:MAG: hypothetical protein OXI24_03145, partial [Candidatus Poribacteria bacterium]|nr:hypothetical protein [Candidatus Poribacteria bacterium]
MYYKNHINPVILTLIIIMSVLMCAFTTVMADQHSEAGEEAEATDEAEASEDAEGTDEAETATAEEPVRLEELVVVGTRAQPRSILDSAVPIDIVSNESFEKQGGADLPDLLRALVPSYNVNTQP